MVQKNGRSKAPVKCMKSASKIVERFCLSFHMKHDILILQVLPGLLFTQKKLPHHLVGQFLFSCWSDEILWYARCRYFFTASTDKLCSIATCTQLFRRTSHSMMHAVSSGGNSRDKIYSMARRGAIADNSARIRLC
nr:MAG TPA: hypothetical protein [Bacteriophage sp.]